MKIIKQLTLNGEPNNLNRYIFLFIRFSHDNNVFKKARNSIVSMYIKPEAIIKMGVAKREMQV
jgi:hypothetical protein